VRFVDTSFWVALALRRDQHHSAASTLWAARNGPLMSTNHIVGEVWTFLRRRDGHQVARRARLLIEQSIVVQIIHVDEQLEREAWRWLDRHNERAYSFVDATSFAVMRRRGLLEAYAFDEDFSVAGFVEVRAT